MCEQKSNGLSLCLKKMLINYSKLLNYVLLNFNKLLYVNKVLMWACMFSDCKIIVICNKRYLKVYGHLFNRQRNCGKGWAWYCHMYHRGCKSAVVTTTDLNIVEYKEDHNHLPPQLYRSWSGDYYICRRNSIRGRQHTTY